MTMSQHHQPLLYLLLAALSVSACQSMPPATTRGIELTRVAKLVSDQGSSKVMGSMKLPSSIVTRLIANNSASLIANNAASFRISSLGDIVPLSRIKVRVVDLKGDPLQGVSTVQTDKDGTFTLSQVPVGSTILVEGLLETHGQLIKLHKYLKPTEALTCAKVDLASTLVADKIISSNPLIKNDPGLQGSNIADLVNPDKLQQVEDDLRKALDSDSAPAPQKLSDALVAGTVPTVFDQLVEDAPYLGTSYQQTFERLDGSLGIRVAAVGSNTATIRGKEGPTVMGVMTLKPSGTPPGTVRVEYWLNNQKIREVPFPGESALDTWSLPNGPCTLEVIAVGGDGHRETLAQTYMVIRNLPDALCP